MTVAQKALRGYLISCMLNLGYDYKKINSFMKELDFQLENITTQQALYSYDLVYKIV